MKKVLYIKANAKPDGTSRTFEISDYFVEEYKKAHPEDEIITLDLYKENIDFLRTEDFGSIFGPKSEESKQHPVLKYAYQFAEADRYIFAAPMWNLSFPAILKAYIDYISVTGITFKYTAEGPIGLLNNKKAVHIVSRGGAYNGTDIEMGDLYLKTVLSFYGVEDVETIAAENMDVMGVDTDAELQKAKDHAEKIAKEF